MERNNLIQKKIWNLIAEIPDPEIPVVSISDLGILREVNVKDRKVTVTISPTYQECPAIGFFKEEITTILQNNGHHDVEVVTSYVPAWTSNWIDIMGKEKLRKSGIAPPVKKCAGNCNSTTCKPKVIRCPLCRSRETTKVAEVSSTVCKALYACSDCNETFEYFKSV